MAEIRGKFITLACSFLNTRPQIKQEAEAAVQRLTGTAAAKLDPEEFYDTRVLDSVFQVISAHEDELGAWVAKKVIGQEVYSTIKWTAGIPEHVTSPLDYVKFEAEGFLANHRGSDVTPRRIVSAENGHVVVEARSPGYDCTWIEGVYEGILRMNNIYDGKVTQTRCIKNGDATCEFDITW